MARFGCGVSGRTCAREHITPASFYTTGSCTIPQSPRLRMCAHTFTPGMSRPPLSHARIVQTGQDPRDEMDHSRAQPAHGRRQLRPLYVRFGRRGQAGWVCRRGPMQQRGAGVRRSTQRGWMRASENSAATCSATAPPCHNATPVRTETSGVKARSGAEGRGQGVRGKSYKQGQSVEQAGGSGPERILR
jgi:hypothetical protein